MTPIGEDANHVPNFPQTAVHYFHHHNGSVNNSHQSMNDIINQAGKVELDNQERPSDYFRDKERNLSLNRPERVKRPSELQQKLFGTNSASLLSKKRFAL